MEYTQSVCDTAAAMKICENYILDGDHCVDIISNCRNMTFKEDKKSLTMEYEYHYRSIWNFFITDCYEWSSEYYDYYVDNNSDKSVSWSWITIITFILILI